MFRLLNDKADHVTSFSRQKNNDKMIAVFNFDSNPVKVKLNAKHHAGNYTELFSGTTYELKGDDELSLPAWGYLVLTK